MASDRADHSADSDKRYSALAAGLALGSLLVVAGAGVSWWRLDRPAYQLTADAPVVEVSLDDDPDLSRHRTLTVAFQNTGRHPLKLVGTETSCSCTIAGELPQQIIAPDEHVAFDVSVTLPAYDDERTSLIVNTVPPSPQPVKVSFLMHGTTVRTPYVNRMPKSIELTTHLPDEPVEHLIELETGEAADFEPWLTGLDVGNESVTIELVREESLPNRPAPGVVNRIYTFRLTMNGPPSPYSPVSFPIRPVGRTKPVLEPEHCMVSVVYRPAIRIFPQRLLIHFDDQTVFPYEQLLTLSRSDDEPMPTIQQIQVPADWITAEVIPPEMPLHEQHVNVTIDKPTTTGRESELIVNLADESTPSLHIPITLASSSSP